MGSAEILKHARSRVEHLLKSNLSLIEILIAAYSQGLKDAEAALRLKPLNGGKV